jgi:hypothetical protein
VVKVALLNIEVYSKLKSSEVAEPVREWAAPE